MAISSRVLRKIRGDDSILKQRNSDESDADDTILQKPSHVNNNINRYGLLNDDSESDSEIKENDDNEPGPSTSKEPEIKNNQVSRKKKKKKKPKHVEKIDKPKYEDLDEVERSVREVNAILGNVSDVPIINKQTKLEGEQGVLSIDKRCLNSKNELRKMFGSGAVQNGESSVIKKRKHRGHIKRLYLMPHFTYSMQYDPTQTMKIVKEDNGVVYFKYEHDSHYQSVERKFRSSIESMDTSQFIMLGNRYPLHVNTLIQLSETFAINEEFSTAAKFIERAVFALEIAFHPSFSILKGNCRLDYKIQENRALFIALFKYMTYLGEKACYRTALELSKVILSLSPDEDPLAVVLAMDFYAIRSGEYKWLLKFLEEFGPRRNLSMLPNMAYSQALAHYFLNEIEKADELLQDALIMFPGVLIQLLEKCHVSPDPKTLASDFFRINTWDSEGYKKLTELFITQSHYVWKEPTVLRWLEKNTLVVLERVEKKDPAIEAGKTKRATRFLGKLPLVFQRHLFLTGIPFQATDDKPMYLFDPLPPADSINVYTETVEIAEDLSNSLTLFFRSMMPSYTPAAWMPVDNERRREEPEPDDGAAARRAPLLESVTELHDAVSNLLYNLINREDNYDDEADSED